jgi:hypothetical protein
MDWIMMDWEGISHLFISWWNKRGAARVSRTGEEAGRVPERGEKALLTDFNRVGLDKEERTY